MKKKLRAMIMFEWITCMKRTYYSFLSLTVKYLHEKEIKGYDYVWVNEMPEKNILLFIFGLSE